MMQPVDEWGWDLAWGGQGPVHARVPRADALPPASDSCLVLGFPPSWCTLIYSNVGVTAELSRSYNYLPLFLSACSSTSSS